MLRPGRWLVLGVRVYVLLIYLHTYTHRCGLPAVGSVVAVCSVLGAGPAVGSVPGVGRGAGAVAGPVAVLCRCCASVLVLVRAADWGRRGVALNKLRGYLCERSSGGSFAGSADRVKRIFSGSMFMQSARGGVTRIEKTSHDLRGVFFGARARGSSFRRAGARGGSPGFRSHSHC